MATSGVTLNPYDEVPYPSQPLQQSHPDRLAAIATLFGMQPVPIERCRVLELGCASGGNLLPMAEQLPEARFVGIDYSSTQIIAAERAAGQLGLTNIELRHADIGALGDELGMFDYIICHGVFSWVPPELQAAILSICRRSLSPQGVAYISYNVYPGWHIRSVMREIMCRFAPPDRAASERIARGRQLLEFLSKSLELEGSNASRVLKAEVDAVRRQPESYVYHEYFEGHNRPTYFHEFVERAAQFDLQYLGEAAVATMFASNFGPKVEQQLANLAPNLVAGEQHLDVLRNRAFRQSLLVHRDVPLARHITPAQIDQLRFSGQIRSENPQPDLKSSAVEKFQTSFGLILGSPTPLFKATLYYLGRQWPRAFSLDELLAAVAELISSDSVPVALSDQDRQNLGQNLIQCVANGVLEISSAPDGFVTTISERPLAAGLSRSEARAGLKVTNRRHLLIDLDTSTKKILTCLDGAHDHEAIVHEMVEAVQRGEVSILVDGIPTTDREAITRAMHSQLQQSLASLAANALLIA